VSEPQRHFDRQSKGDHPDYPYICRECRGVVFGPGLAHQCEQWRCPQCLGVLSRQGFCPYCGDRFEFPKTDLVQELAELKAWLADSVIEIVEPDTSPTQAPEDRQVKDA
jgi:hypothetical protein